MGKVIFSPPTVRGGPHLYGGPFGETPGERATYYGLASPPFSGEPFSFFGWGPQKKKLGVKGKRGNPPPLWKNFSWVQQSAPPPGGKVRKMGEKKKFWREGPPLKFSPNQRGNPPGHVGGKGSVKTQKILGKPKPPLGNFPRGANGGSFPPNPPRGSSRGGPAKTPRGLDLLWSASRTGPNKGPFSPPSSSTPLKPPGGAKICVVLPPRGTGGKNPKKGVGKAQNASRAPKKGGKDSGRVNHVAGACDNPRGHR